MNDLKILDSAMKTPGWIESKLIKCGKANCKCSRGELHGPYFYYRYWKLYHKAWIPKKKYLTQAKAEKLSKALLTYRHTILTVEDPYRAVRKGIRFNIRSGVTDMTQRRLAKVSVLTRNFL